MLSSTSPLSDWLAWLEALSPKEIDLGLDRVQRALDRLQLQMPDDLLLIAGTNGKGSCVAMADALLRATGKRVGAYTSPHLFRYNERIVVDGVAVDDAAIIAAFQSIEAVRGDIVLTYFEFSTLAAVTVFAMAELDVWILEIGLGGRLDACNAFDPSASLITNVSLDHCDWLGDDVETIAVEKAGVMRAARTTVFGAKQMPNSIAHRARAIAANVVRAGVDFDFETVSEQRWNWRGPSRSMHDLLAPGLLGEFQIGNAAAVLMLLESAGLAAEIDDHLVNSVLPNVSLPGRLQSLHVNGVQWLLDVAHNAAAAEALAGTLGRNTFRARTIAIVGMLDDKDVAAVTSPLLACVDRWIAIRADSPRAIPAAELARKIANISGLACLVANTLSEALEFARHSASENDRILVTGSFYTVAPVVALLSSDSRTQP